MVSWTRSRPPRIREVKQLWHGCNRGRQKITLSPRTVLNAASGSKSMPEMQDKGSPRNQYLTKSEFYKKTQLKAKPFLCTLYEFVAGSLFRIFAYKCVDGVVCFEWRESDRGRLMIFTLVILRFFLLSSRLRFIILFCDLEVFYLVLRCLFKNSWPLSTQREF